MPHSAISQPTAATGRRPPVAAVRPLAASRTRRGPERADLLGQLDRPARGLAEPERHRGRRALRVHDPDDAGLDPPDPPRGRAQQEDVTRHALDGPVLVDGARRGCRRARRAPGSRRARGSPRPRSAPRAWRRAGPQPPVDLVPVQVGGAAAAAGADPLGEQVGDLVEVAPPTPRRTARRRGPGPAGRPRPTRPPRTRPRSAGRGCRAGTAE